MEFLEILLQALFLGLSGVGMPLTIITYCVLSSIRNSGRIGVFLFSGHLTVQILLSGALLLSADLLIESPAIQIILNLVGFSLCTLFGIKLAMSALKGEPFLISQGLEQPINEFYSAQSEYADIYSFSSNNNRPPTATRFQTPSKNSTGGTAAFLLAFVFTITNVPWLLWFDISAKSFLFKAYISCGTSIGGIFGATIFVVAFLFAEFVFYVAVSKIAAFIGSFLNATLLRILTAVAALSFIFSAIFMMIDVVKTVLFIL